MTKFYVSSKILKIIENINSLILKKEFFVYFFSREIKLWSIYYNILQTFFWNLYRNSLEPIRGWFYEILLYYKRDKNYM